MEHIDGKKWVSLGKRVSSFISLKGLCLKRNKESCWGRVYAIINPITKKYSLAPISNYNLEQTKHKDELIRGRLALDGLAIYDVEALDRFLRGVIEQPLDDLPVYYYHICNERLEVMPDIMYREEEDES